MTRSLTEPERNQITSYSWDIAAGDLKYQIAVAGHNYAIGAITYAQYAGELEAAKAIYQRAVRLAS